jgi:hypothetical protein
VHGGYYLTGIISIHYGIFEPDEILWYAPCIDRFHEWTFAIQTVIENTAFALCGHDEKGQDQGDREMGTDGKGKQGARGKKPRKQEQKPVEKKPSDNTKR